MQNIKNGIYGLKKRFFTPTQMEYLKQNGFVPEDAEIPTEYNCEEE